MSTLASGSIDLKSLKVAGEGASKYITEINEGGIKIHDSQRKDLDYLQLTSSGMDIYQEVDSASTKVARFGANGIDFYGFYYPGSSGTSMRNFGQIAHLGTTCQLGNDVDNHIVINDTGLLLYSKSDSSPHAILGTSNNLSTYNNYKKYFKTTWEYGTPFSFRCSVENGLGTYTFYVEENREFVNTGMVIIIDDITYFISSSASSTGSSLNYTFSSADNNNVRTVNIMIEFTGNAIFPGPRFQFGKNNNPVGTNSCTIGEGLIALANSQIALGQYNELDFESMLVVGNGINNANRSNLMTISNDEVKIGNNNKGHTIINENGMRIYGGDGTTQLANIGYGEGQSQSSIEVAPYYTFGHRITTAPVYDASQTYKSGDICMYGNPSVLYINVLDITTPEEWNPNRWNLARGNYSVAEGGNSVAGGVYSHTEGYGCKTVQPYDHAEGRNTIASGGYAHAEGGYTHAWGGASHAEGYSTLAKNSYAHAEGYKTVARGMDSHAEGFKTMAIGFHSHTQNLGTVADEIAQTAIGKYNIATRSGSGTEQDPYVYSDAGNYSFIIGNGTGDATEERSNAFTVAWDGNIELELKGYILTADTTIDGSKTYYTYDDTTKKYTAVASPVVGDIGTYYERTNTVDTNIYDILSNLNWIQEVVS